MPAGIGLVSFNVKFYFIQTEYGEIRSICPYSVRMWKNTDQNNFKYGHSLHCTSLYSFILEIYHFFKKTNTFFTFFFLFFFLYYFHM